MTHTAPLCRNNSNDSNTTNIASDNSPVGRFMNLFADADPNQPLAYCDNCREPTQKDMEILGARRRVPILCRCRIETNEREKKESELRDLRRRLERFKVYSLMDNRFEVSTFENWQHRRKRQIKGHMYM